jgi:hypothetical protein
MPAPIAIAEATRRSPRERLTMLETRDEGAGG